MVCQGRVGHVGGKCAGLGRVVRWIFRSFCFDESNSENDEKCSYGEFLDVGWWGRIQVVTRCFPERRYSMATSKLFVGHLVESNFEHLCHWIVRAQRTVSALKCDTQ